ncbi:hypothetical protein CFS9_20560 [Flavobacterium sp. CFS9]|uniref:Uncharacterized protein n=1 Tax=Flavobacterium sp. CFS9 TaxID=3143118 RepID=A0AAT9H1Y2_9FLAO
MTRISQKLFLTTLQSYFTEFSIMSELLTHFFVLNLSRFLLQTFKSDRFLKLVGFKKGIINKNLAS